MRRIRVGSRESRLAVVQAELVMEAIRAFDPAVELELVTMKTTGDKILDRTLDQIGGKGLFVRELDAALLEGRVDLTVHSCKDLPMETDPRLPLVAFSRREDPRDALVYPQGDEAPDWSRPIGSSSLRRRLQLADLFPGIETAPVRGNVQTRLRKLDEGQYSALVLAGAGLKRLGLEGRIARLFSVSELLPAAGQGILAIQGRAGADYSYLSGFHCRDAADCALAERAFVRRLDGGCSSPVAAYATVEGDGITIDGLFVDEAGRVLRGQSFGPRKAGEALARDLADRLKEGHVCAEK